MPGYIHELWVAGQSESYIMPDANAFDGYLDDLMDGGLIAIKFSLLERVPLTWNCLALIPSRDFPGSFQRMSIAALS